MAVREIAAIVGSTGPKGLQVPCTLCTTTTFLSESAVALRDKGALVLCHSCGVAAAQMAAARGDEVEIASSDSDQARAWSPASWADLVEGGR